MSNFIGKDFLRFTSFEHLDPSAQSQGAPPPALELPLPESAQVIDLPDGKALKLANIDLIELIEKRETVRQYSSESLTLAELAFLLWGTQGVKTISDKGFTRRTVPSAGSRHPFDTFLLVNHVEGLQPGFYRYIALEHKIARLPAGEDLTEKIAEACRNQQHIVNSAVTFIWVADIQRSYWRFAQRAYRYIFLDAGHICQNLYLLAGAIGCGVCAIASYDDNQVNTLLGLDGEKYFSVYLASLGKRQ